MHDPSSLSPASRREEGREFMSTRRLLPAWARG